MQVKCYWVVTAAVKIACLIKVNPRRSVSLEVFEKTLFVDYPYR